MMNYETMKWDALNLVENAFDCILVFVSSSREVLSDLIHNKSNIRLGKPKILEATEYVTIETSI